MHIYDPSHSVRKKFLKREISDELRIEYQKEYYKEVNYRKRLIRFWLFFEIISLVVWLGSDLLHLDDAIIFIAGMCFFFGTPVIVVSVLIRGIITDILNKRREKRLIQQSRQEMQIPESAVHIELFHPQGGERILCVSHYGYLCNHYRSWCFVENGRLCIADCFSCLEIPLSALQKISPEPSWGKIHGWMQKKHPQTRFFRRHKVKCLGNNEFLVQFCRIEFWDNTGEYYFCIPNYELEKFSELTKLRLYTE